MKILIIDNYDSFTFNLYQYVGELFKYRVVGDVTFDDVEIKVKRNDEITLKEVRSYAPDRIIISPGPGTPEDKAYFGVCSDVITEIGPTTPILGVCLGMQGIGYCFGGKIILANEPMHGKTSTIIHNGESIFNDLPQDLEVMRYHSLIIDPATIPHVLEITAVTSSKKHMQLDTQPGDRNFKALISHGEEIMGVCHKEYPIYGIQFHPESFATEGGKRILKNFIILPAPSRS